MRKKIIYFQRELNKRKFNVKFLINYLLIQWYV